MVFDRGVFGAEQRFMNAAETLLSGEDQAYTTIDTDAYTIRGVVQETFDTDAIGDTIETMTDSYREKRDLAAEKRVSSNEADVLGEPPGAIKTYGHQYGRDDSFACYRLEHDGETIHEFRADQYWCQIRSEDGCFKELYEVTDDHERMLSYDPEEHRICGLYITDRERSDVGAVFAEDATSGLAEAIPDRLQYGQDWPWVAETTTRTIDTPTVEDAGDLLFRNDTERDVDRVGLMLIGPNE